MSDKRKLDDELLEDATFEYRVWGKYPKACRKLARMATEETIEEIQDCYLLVDDAEWNAKVRKSTLKVKRLVAEKRGFEAWTSNWHRDANTTPAPFDELYDELSLDRHQRGKRYDIKRAAKALDDDSEARAVFVTKHRTRYRIKSIIAEVTSMDVKDTDTRLHTVAVQGDDLDDLVALLRKVGLDGLPNVPMHTALENEVVA